MRMSYVTKITPADVAAANFHKGTLENPAFFALRTAGDVHGQTVPGGILQFQPKLGTFDNILSQYRSILTILRKSLTFSHQRISILRTPVWIGSSVSTRAR